jgi:hypothetical protein
MHLDYKKLKLQQRLLQDQLDYEMLQPVVEEMSFVFG